MSHHTQSRDDEQLFARWTTEHGAAVRGFLLAMVRRGDVADDLYQEVFCRAWQARQRYREQGNARAYLLRIADRLVCDQARRANPCIHLDADGWKRHDPPDAAREPWQTMSMSEQAQRLSAALDQLTPMQRRVLLLRYYGQMSFSDIAAAIDCPLNTTLSHCHRGLETLRKLLVEQSR